MTLGQRIQELRKRAGLTQEQLAEQLGVTRQAVSKWESDPAVPGRPPPTALSRSFKPPRGELLGGEEPRREEPGREEPSRDTAADTERRVEEVLRRYVEATRRQAPPMYGKYGWKAPLIAVAGLLTLVVVLGVKIGSLDSALNNVLNGRMAYLESSVSNLTNQVNSMEYQLQEILAAQADQNSLLSSFDCQVAGFDPERETVTLALSANLKTYEPGMQIQFALDWTREDQTGQQETRWLEGPNYLAEIELPMNWETACTLRLRDGDGVIQEQLVENAVTQSLIPEAFQLSADSLSAFYSIAVGNSATVTAEDLAVRIFSRYPELFWPEEAVLTVALNGEVLESAPLALSQEGTGTWYGRDDLGVREIRLGQEDVLELSLRLMDSLGREMVCRETILGDEDAPQESPPMPVIYDGRR